jgi:hypothetical protein
MTRQCVNIPPTKRTHRPNDSPRSPRIAIRAVQPPAVPAPVRLRWIPSPQPNEPKNPPYHAPTLLSSPSSLRPFVPASLSSPSSLCSSVDPFPRGWYRDTPFASAGSTPITGPLPIVRLQPRRIPIGHVPGVRRTWRASRCPACCWPRASSFWYGGRHEQPDPTTVLSISRRHVPTGGIMESSPL